MRLRRRAMIEVSVGFTLVTLIHATASLAGDRRAWSPRRLARSLYRVLRCPLVSREFARRLRAYNRTGFHPNDRDTSAVLDVWRAQLPTAA